MIPNSDPPVFTLILIVINLGFSLLAFSQPTLIDKYKFNVGAIQRGEWWRMVTGNFLHANFTHLLFNMYSFYIFGEFLETLMGGPLLLAIYFGSMLAGDILAMVIHRDHPTYSAVGASGAVSGVIFAFIMFFPFHLLLLFFIIPIPAFVFGILYVAFSLYGIPNRSLNIGHEAHLGGAIVGAIIGFLIIPIAPYYLDLHMVDRIWLLAVLVVPSVVVLYLYIYRPDSIRIVNMWSSKGREIQRKRNAHDRHYSKEKLERDELNDLLDKVSRKGLDGLSEKEKQRLKELSDRLS